MKKIPISVLPMDKKLEVRPDSTLLAALQQARVPIMNRCGGNGSCGTCKVQVAAPDGTAPTCPLTRSEKRLLGDREIQAGMRLSCQYKVEAPLVVTVPETPLQRTVRKMMEEARNNPN